MAVDLDLEPVSLLKVLADPIRWNIVELLANEELCVCHLVDELDAPQSLVSHHLRVLREAGLVIGERWSYWTYYRLVPEPFAALAARLSGGVKRRGARPRRPCC